jgi:pimeloyl-ACP methyl ester carboxylesterase
MNPRPLYLLLALCLSAALHADGPKDNHPQSVRPIPPPGVEVPADQKRKLEAGLRELEQAIASLDKRRDAWTPTMLPDVKIFHKAVRDALIHNEFFTPKEIPAAFDLLKLGLERAAHLADGKAPWTTARGLVVRGYVSRLDGSVQPYGLVVPDSYQPDGPLRFRLDLWFHGRGETLSELNFIQQRLKTPGQFTPADTIVLHPYGRYSNANKFAGEVDAMEALDSVRRHYRVDDDRVAVRGFSMGGASTWHLAVHHADRWCAANPGAGFSETPRFLKVFQDEQVQPTWWERKLWHWYNCDDWARNLHNVPVVAYSGELDRQKQAADVMQEAMREQGLDLVHIIGPQTAHKYEPAAAAEVERRMTALAAAGRNRLPRAVRFVTYTLAYNRMHWLSVDGLAEHWQRSEVDAAIVGFSNLAARTVGVTALTFHMDSGLCPFTPDAPVRLVIDDQTLDAPRPRSDRSWRVSLHLDGKVWKLGPQPRPATSPAKIPGLQGPIDHAFMDSFLFVQPTGSTTTAAGRWAQAEMERAIREWRRHFRGEVRLKPDTAVTDQDIAQHHLILWGEPATNAVMKRITPHLPIQWTADALRAGDRSFDPAQHALISVYPNPLNPARYVVLNSGFTFREYAYLNNARQVPMLPDWAVVDLRTPPDTVWPGNIAAAGFFDEHWRLKSCINP